MISFVSAASAGRRPSDAPDTADGADTADTTERFEAKLVVVLRGLGETAEPGKLRPPENADGVAKLLVSTRPGLVRGRLEGAGYTVLELLLFAGIVIAFLLAELTSLYLASCRLWKIFDKFDFAGILVFCQLLADEITDFFSESIRTAP